MKHFFAYCFLFLFSVALKATALPPNDDVCSATYLGVLPAPYPCPWGWGTPLYLNGEFLTGSTRNFPEHKQLNCINGGNMVSGGGDVWYKFTVSGNYLFVHLENSTITNPFIGLYHKQNGCLDLVPVQCWQGVYAECSNLTEGDVYYLQILDNTTAPNGSGNFDLKVESSNKCIPCEQDVEMRVVPTPVNGYYHPGDTVMFEFTINNYRRVFGNSLHSFVPRITGSGWQLPNSSTFVSYPQSSCGAWGHQAAINTPDFGPLFGAAFDRFATDGNPFNNGGDTLPIGGKWTFRIKLVTQLTPTVDMPLSIEFYTYSDNETGLHQLPGCRRDTMALFNATLSKCKNVGLTVVNPICSTPCSGNAVVNYNINNTPPTYNYNWYSQNGNLVQSTLNTASPTNTIGSLCVGGYVLISTYNGGGCFSTRSINIDDGFGVYPIDYGFNYCNPNANTGYAYTTTIPTNGNYTYTWYPSGITSPSHSNLPSGTNILVVTDINTGCVDSLTLNLMPDTIDATVNYPDTVICINNNQPIVPDYIATPGGTFFIMPSGGPIINPQTGVITSYSSSLGYYTVGYYPPGNWNECRDTFYFTLHFQPTYDQSFCYCPKVFCKYDNNVFYPQLATSGGVFSVISGGPLNINPNDGSFTPSANNVGQYIIKYDATNLGPCGFIKIDTINIIFPVPTISGPTTQSYCSGDNILPIVATAQNLVVWFNDITLLQLSSNQINGTLFPPQNLSVGTHDFYAATFVVMPHGDTCYGFIQVIINIHPTPQINIGNDTTVCSGFTAQLFAHGGTTGDNYVWSNGQITQGISVNPTATTTYSVIVTNQSGCTRVDGVTVFVDNSPSCGDSLVFFNGITPNGDGLNDYWHLDGITNFPINTVTIYNRWGEKVWFGKNYDNFTVKFDGENDKGDKLPTGTYYFVIQIPEKQFKGWIELTR